MPLSAYCPTCERSLYVGSSEELVCPVCSSPLELVDEGQAAENDAAEGPQPGGAK